MIPKGNQRGGGRQLATHLLNEYDNDRVEVFDLRGSVSPDLHGAFHEWYAHSLSTKAEKYLYSLSVSPDLAKYDLTRDQYLDFIDRTERSLKLVGQPRAVVFHVKDGREHAHIVWSRIDVERGRAVHMPKDRMTLRRVAQEFARDHGLPLPERMKDNGRKDRFNERAKTSNLAEKQQEERSGISLEDRMAAILRAWNNSRDGREFVQNLEQEGYYLARGDSKSYVVIDRAGEVHSLARQLKGTAKAKDVKDRLGIDYPTDKLPDVEAARLHAAAVREALKIRQQEKEQTREKAQELRDRQVSFRRTELTKDQQERRAKLEADRAEMAGRIEAERAALKDMQQAEISGALASRKPPGRMLAFLTRITGIQAVLDARRQRQDAARDRAHEMQAHALAARHEREQQEIGRRERNLAALDAREKYSLETALGREEFQRIIEPEREITPEFTRAAEPERTVDRNGDGGMPARKGVLRALYNRVSGLFAEKETEAQPAPPPRKPPGIERAPEIDLVELAADFNRSAARERERETGRDDGRFLDRRGPER